MGKDGMGGACGYSDSKADRRGPLLRDLEKKVKDLERKLRRAESSRNYLGWGRFVIHRIDRQFEKYELMHSEVIQFGHTVSYTPSVKKAMKESIDRLSLGEALRNKNKLQEPNEWLDEYVSNCMPSELENMVDGYDFEVELDGFAEICGYLLVTDTSSDTPYGYEYDSELGLEEPQFTQFKLEDLKNSSYYTARDIAEWERGGDEELVEERYRELVAEGYRKTWEHLSDEQDAQEELHLSMMCETRVPLNTLPKQSDLDPEEEDESRTDEYNILNV